MGKRFHCGNRSENPCNFGACQPSGRERASRIKVLNSGMPMPLAVRFRFGSSFQNSPISSRQSEISSAPFHQLRLMEPAVRAPREGPDRSRIRGTRRTSRAGASE